MDNSPDRSSIPNDAPEEARLRATYASFGDDGVTATATAYGHLLQITRYFGNRPSGFFCIDLPHILEPYHVGSRTEQLQNSCSDPKDGMRLRFDDSEVDESWEIHEEIPKMGFIQDRWPTFNTESSSFDIEIRYWISNKTVYQMYTFTLKDGLTPQQIQIPPIMVNADVRLRNLDFTRDDAENSRDTSSSSYRHQRSSDGKYIIAMHQVQETGRESLDGVALLTSIMINRSLQNWVEDGTNNFIIPPALSLLNNGKLEITVAYTLEVVSSATVGTTPSVVPEHLDIAQQIFQGPFQAISFTEDQHLNFILRRNLEHILSVCSIPIDKPFRNDSGSQDIEANDGKAYIALTCGDISGHMIENSASFYAFQFLLIALEHFNNAKSSCSCNAGSISLCGNYACRMYSRIWRVCEGHLNWLCHVHSNMKPEQGRHNPRYWATGEVTAGWDSSSETIQGPDIGINSLEKLLNNYLSLEMPLTSALFSIIKAAGFYQVISDNNTQAHIARDFENLVSGVVKNLHQNNKRNSYMFPRHNVAKDLEDEISRLVENLHYEEEYMFLLPMRDTTQIFYTSDHAKIWWALKSAEEIGLGSKLFVNIDKPKKLGQDRMSYSSEKIHESIHKYLTTENPTTATEMTAVSRCLSENNFLLGVDDTVLFHAMNHGLFDDQGSTGGESEDWKNKIDVWKNTIEYHAQYQDDDISDQSIARSYPLQLALTMIMPTNNMDPLRKTAYSNAKSALLSSSSPNGLFPGQLDKDREPILFVDEAARDLYWHTTFEVPYILWKYKVPLTYEHKVAASSSNLSSSDVTQVIEKMLKHLDTMTAATKSSKYESSVVEIPDEWLYNEPSLFTSNYHPKNGNKEKFYIDAKKGRFGAAISRAVQYESGTKRQKELEDNAKGYAIDVPKKNYTDGKYYKHSLHVFSTDREISAFMDQERTTTNAKKRFFHFRTITLMAALTCYIASSERKAISAFFDHHGSYDRYFFEDTTAVRNEWVTELHLPFYRIARKLSSSEGHAHVAQPEGILFPSIGKKENSIWVSRSIMSFRFEGDIFDRFWTCHFLEYNPRKMAEMIGEEVESDKTDILKTAEEKVRGAVQGGAWNQRKILELILFDMMLDEMLEAAKEILILVQQSVVGNFNPDTFHISDIDRRELASALMVRFNLMDEVDNDTFLSMSHQWSELQRVLQVVKDELNDNLETISLWTNRVKDRGRVRPRWTLNDERKHQSAIFKLRMSNTHKVDALRQYVAQITYFDIALTRKTGNARNERDQRGANDLRLFTYVTVIFLPLSFGTSIYSMSGAPSRQTLIHMIITAIVALFATMIALINTNLLDKILGPVFSGARHIFGLTVKLIYLMTIGPIIYLLARYVLFPIRGKSFHIRKPVTAFSRKWFGKLSEFGMFSKLNAFEYARRQFESSREIKARRKERVQRYKFESEVRKDLEADKETRVKFKTEAEAELNQEMEMEIAIHRFISFFARRPENDPREEENFRNGLMEKQEPRLKEKVEMRTEIEVTKRVDEKMKEWTTERQRAAEEQKEEEAEKKKKRDDDEKEKKAQKELKKSNKLKEKEDEKAKRIAKRELEREQANMV